MCPLIFFMLIKTEQEPVFQTEAELAREVFQGVEAQLPDEKKLGARDMVKTAKELEERGSDRIDGRGQLIGSIPPRIYMRWQLMLPGCWQDKQFVQEFLYDNPQCRGVGYRPTPNQARHGFTGIGASFYQQNKDKVVA